MPPEWVEPQGGQTVEHHESSHVHPAQDINPGLNMGVAPSDQVTLSDWALSHLPAPSPPLPQPPPHQYEPSHLVEITEIDYVTDSCLTAPPPGLGMTIDAGLQIMSVPIPAVPEQLCSLLSINR